ncbi:hypothetical protein G7Y79_00020g049010 [Physcia stellaris]|nr:hypothetical protein G7Y79_00020g049010 [Physcia stellaris]
MTFKPDRPYPLRWSGGYYEGPVWPPEREINIGVVRSLAKKHLSGIATAPLDELTVEVSFFAEGAFNKLYQISAPELPSSYLLRVTIPVEPFFKTESEVATIAFLRSKTSIPVPNIIAWQSNIDLEDDLGYEWMLMEKIDGVALYDVWRKVPWDRKLALVDDIAELITELQNHVFNEIGALYFKSKSSGTAGNTVEPPVLDADTIPEVYENEMTGESDLSKTLRPHMDGAPRSIDTNHKSFEVGRFFHESFFKASRYYLPGNRGPYKSPLQWLTALVQFQLEWINRGPVEGDNDYDSDFEEDAIKIKPLCQKYLEILPSVFKDDDNGPYVLHHHDLNLANIIVDPETFDIRGIVDWEMVNVVPMWKATSHPEFLMFIVPFPEETSAPPTPSYEDEEDSAVYKRDRWDYQLLRDRWDATMKRLNGDMEKLPDPRKAEIKNECLRTIVNLTSFITRAEIWLEEFKRESSSDAENRDKESPVDKVEKHGSERGSSATKQFAQTKIENTAGAEIHFESEAEGVSKGANTDRGALKEEHEIARRNSI